VSWQIDEQEKNARHPKWLWGTNFGILLSGGLLVTSLLFGFVTFMNAPARAPRRRWAARARPVGRPIGR